MNGNVKFERSLNGYRVLLDGEDIGEVTKYEKGFNLRRYIVIRGWRAKTADGRKLWRADGATGETRAEAVEALVADLAKT